MTCTVSGTVMKPDSNFVTSMTVEARVLNPFFGPCHRTIQDITYCSVTFGNTGTSISVAYTAGGTAGAEVVTVTGNAISVQIQSAVSTATQVLAALQASAAAMALVYVEITGTAGNAQVTASAINLKASHLITPYTVTTTTASDGVWSLNLIRLSSVLITIDYPPNLTDSAKRYTYAITVPNSATANFDALATEL